MVLVTGSGLPAGRLLVQELVKRNDRVRTFDPYPVHGLPEECEALTGSFTGERDLARALSGADTLYHFFDEPEVGNQGRSHMKAMNVDATERLVLAAARAKVKQVVFLSSWEVYGKIRKIPANDKTPLRPSTPYGKDKRIAEAVIRRVASQFPLKAAILRAPRILGEGFDDALYLFIFFLATMQEENMIYVSGNGKNRVQYVHPADVARAAILAGEKNAEGVFNLGTGDAAPAAEFYRSLLGSAVQQKNIGGLKLALMGAVARLFNFHYFTPAHRLLLTSSVMLDAKRAEDILGWHPAFSSEKAFATALDWYRKNKTAAKK